MKFKYAAILLLIICAIIVSLLLTELISSFVAGILFAVSLVICGIFSKGFRK